jgi:PadR family transcriptional regulator PadR
MPNSGTIRGFEEDVMLAIMQLADNAYGASIYETLEEAGRRTNVGSLYVTLGRLEGKGFISSRAGEPTAIRGGRAKIYYKVEGAGLRALASTEEIRNRLRGNLRLEGNQA